MITAGAYGQVTDKTLGLARQYTEEKEYDKAVPLFKQLYDQAPFDKNRYDEYLDVLLLAGKYESATELVSYMARIRRGDPVMEIDMGRVFLEQDDKKAANRHFEAAIAMLQGDELVTKRMADAFERLNQLPFAIRSYEHTREVMRHPYMFATELSLLYGKTGDTNKAIEALLDVAMSQPSALENVKSSLLTLIGEDKKKAALLQKRLNQRLLQVPHHPALGTLNSWMYMRKGDYEGALKQLIELEKQLNESDKRILDFGRQAAAEGQDAVALQAFDHIVRAGAQHPYYNDATIGKLAVWQQQLDRKRPVDEAGVARLAAAYQQLLQNNPQYYVHTVVRDYARLMALYQHQPDSAIALLEQAVAGPGMRKEMAGYCKLDIGDYYILSGNVWEATLVYSQVDKAFKEDQLGEEARYKNARLAYYRGDFEWAQVQLSVLKASTTELIANDALYLSVLITENRDSDSNQTALARFAAADLLLFQHKTEASDRLLDSIAQAFPQSELQDDILMLRAEIATEEGRYPHAIAYLERVLESYGDDVLGDDAAYKLALLYDNRLADKQQARKYYETIILEYPGSTYVQQARNRYNEIGNEEQQGGLNP